MVDSVNTLVLANRKVTIEENISDKLVISVGSGHKIEHDELVFSKVSCCWVALEQCKAAYWNKNSGNY